MELTEQPVLEREVRIKARPETIFAFLTDPEKIVRWKGIHAQLDPRAGGAYRVEINHKTVISGKYVEVTPYRRVVFTWGWEGDGSPLPPGASTVEITPVPDGTAAIARRTTAMT